MVKMTASTQTSASVDQVVDNLIDEITDRLHTGQPVNIDDYTRRFPQFEDQLRKLIPTLQAMADLGHSVGGNEKTQTSQDSNSRGTLGDYRIIREIGRGGRGVGPS